MFAYRKYLESEVERLRHENMTLLAALLESRGMREAAMMLRGGQDQVQPKAASTTVTDPRAATLYDKAAGFIGRSWRARRGEAEAKSRAQQVAATTGDSADQLEARIAGEN